MRGMRMTRRTALFSFTGVMVISLFVAGNVGRSLRADYSLDQATYEAWCASCPWHLQARGEVGMA
jgi:hypothetical protein